MRPAVTRDAFAAEFALDDRQRAAVDVLTTSDCRGVYLWGPVGRGKTWLLDRYMSGVDTDAKKRVHFHSFFRDLHASYFGHGFSLEKALDELLGTIELLCFDEFHVHDIGDARLISRMVESLFARKIALVTTSNYPPDGLLPNPLFHDAFIPTIELLTERMQVVLVDGPVDYRTLAGARTHFAAGTWSVAGEEDGITFAELCDTPKSTGDYLAMIENRRVLTITDIPQLKDASRDAVQRFSNLVDVLSDGDVRTDFHSSTPLDAFADGCVGLDIDRIVSRLDQLRRRKCGPDSAESA
ncbi:MAG: cell division protein ZapE [Rhodococcus sp. (in: high G+C Gram-positive bacteria)]|jgi:cell division protein ZapE|uniref:cell division protein ZapE n=1 Tax=Rhodococcus sp. EPR-157 TaxID=1813677 RepID=UPI0007BAF9D8|nr:cell division protein ZapE [Rhodococcus sp. EPR-157]KZF10361.1 hypothetical protein A2J03_01255 [Rhodococcus sp. EPR-157]